MLGYSARWLVDIAAGHPETGLCWFETYALSTERHWENLLIAEGCQAAQYLFQMVRYHLTVHCKSPRWLSQNLQGDL